MGQVLQLRRSRGDRLSTYRRSPPFFDTIAQRTLKAHLNREDISAPPPSAIKQLLSWAKETLGMTCCKETMRKMVHKLGYSYKKVRKFLRKADAAARATYMERLQELLAEAIRGERYLVFIDEAHVHQGLDPGYGWGIAAKPLFVASPSLSGRKKVSFYGLYLYNQGQVRIWGHRKADQWRTMDVLSRLRRELPDAPKLTVIWDNASYHTSEEVINFAKERRDIEIIALPKYSPDLMPVEELWSWFRKEVTRNCVFMQRAHLIQAAERFEKDVNSTPYAAADRLVVIEELHPEREKLLAS